MGFLLMIHHFYNQCRCNRRHKTYTPLCFLESILTSMEMLQKARNGIIIWPSCPTPWYLSWRTKISTLQWNMNINVYSSTIQKSQVMEPVQVLINRSMDKENVLCMHNGVSLNHKENWNYGIASKWMEPEKIMLSERSPT